MEYLVAKETRQILIDAWFDEDERLWLTRGGVCWSACTICAEGEEVEAGYVVEDIPEEEIDPLMNEGYEVLFYINGKVTLDNPEEE